MSQQPQIVPEGNVSEKYRAPERGDKKSRIKLEYILVALIFLFVAFVFAMLVLASLNSIETANKYIPAPAGTPKT